MSPAGGGGIWASLDCSARNRSAAAFASSGVALASAWSISWTSRYHRVIRLRFCEL